MLMHMRHTHPRLQFYHSLPYGANIRDGGVQFSIFSRNATEMRVLLYDRVDQAEPSEVLHMNPRTDRWGDVWSIFVPGLKEGQLYHFQADGPRDPDRGFWFDGSARLVDPWARSLAGKFLPATDGIIRPPRCVVVDDFFDWGGDRHIKRSLNDTVIYELHVRGFTRHESSGVEHPGTYLGVIDKIPYLKSLGITAVELMPIHEFPLNNFNGSTGGRQNYWGYDPLAFFAPHQGYAAGSAPGSAVTEFKQMVRALHEAGIEVILDVVFNHTCEGNHEGPVLSMKGLENSVYYMLEPNQRYYRNYSGCGNTVNGNHPIVREMIFNCLRHWVYNYHIDGFRFDLASILSRDRSGNLVPNPPLIEAISEDPLLADTKIIAEAWDAAGAYQVGSFGSERWTEWNGKYRDEVRRYWRGDGGTRGAFATRLAGSADLYQSGGRPPCASINFITSHDGFTLADLVSYNDKHNLANQEDNRDGENNNYSENHGVEGPTQNPAVLEIRNRQVKNMLTSLMVSQGVPMIVAGDEFQRTQGGNNNAWCQDNPVSWIDWSLAQKHADLLRFTRHLIAFRRSQAAFRRCEFLTGNVVEHTGLPDVSWFNHVGTAVNWSNPDLPMTCLLSAPRVSDDPQLSGRDVLILFNASRSPREFLIPAISRTKHWRMFLDTSAASPDDIFPGMDGPPLPENGVRLVPGRSSAIYVSVATEVPEARP